MSTVDKSWRLCMLTCLLAIILPLSANADEKYDLLQQQVDALQQQLKQVQEALQQYQEDMSVKEGQVEQVVTQLKRDVAAAEEWKNPDTLIHMAGYADVGYSSVSGEDGSFGAGRFAPIFHYQYRDKVMLETELEFQLNDAGETNVEMEYMTIDYFLNDYVALVGGLFLSPVGQFRQNLHPSWINKFASAPLGFGHDGAAPTSEVGLQARGGFQLGGMYTNYSAYISNGPELNSTFEDGEYELEGISSGGKATDVDGKKVFGGRFGILPLPHLEIGISAATGKATVTVLEGGGTPHAALTEAEFSPVFGSLPKNVGDPEEGSDLHAEQARDYDVFGMDFVWGLGSFKLRGEYIKTKIGAATEGITASPGATWEAWYTQLSYLIPQTRIEPVIRYGDFNSPHASQDQTQWGLGINYLISSNVIAKLSYEFNDGESGTRADTDRFMFQLAYGF